MKKKTKAQKKEYHKLVMRRWRDNNRIKAIYQSLKARAKGRGHSCGITLEEFTDWCNETSYHLLRGRFAHNASIDRIKNHIGYEKGNLQILTVGENSSKDNAERHGKPWYQYCDQNPF